MSTFDLTERLIRLRLALDEGKKSASASSADSKGVWIRKLAIIPLLNGGRPTTPRRSEMPRAAPSHMVCSAKAPFAHHEVDR